MNAKPTIQMMRTGLVPVVCCVLVSSCALVTSWQSHTLQRSPQTSFQEKIAFSNASLSFYPDLAGTEYSHGVEGLTLVFSKS